MRRSIFQTLVGTVLSGGFAAAFSAAVAGEAPSVTGELIGNGEKIELPYVYIIAEDEGFYDPGDPAWRLIFAAQEIPARELDSFFFDFPHISLSLTITSEFEDEPTLSVYSQNIKLPTRDGSLSGGEYPQLEMEASGPEHFAGRIYLPEMQEFFEDTYQYDFTFSAMLSDPNAPIGDPLPADGGEPGRAYLAWSQAVRDMDVDKLRSMVSPEQAALLDTEEGMDDLAFMRAMTPQEIRILGGSSDGSMAILDVRAVMDGYPVKGEITMTRDGEHWLMTGEDWSEAED